MAVPALPDTVQDPVTDDFITTAWGDQVNTTIDYALRDGPHCRVFNSGAISIPNNTRTALTFDSERVDVGSMHSTSSNTGRMTITDPGFYLFTGHIDWAANATGQRNCEIRLNGTTLIAVDEIASAASAVALEQSVATQYQCAAADYAEVTVFQTSGGSLNVNASGNYSPEASASWQVS